MVYESAGGNTEGAATVPVATRAHTDTETSQSGSQEEWYGVEEDEDEDFDPVTARRAPLEAAYRAQAVLNNEPTEKHNANRGGSSSPEGQRRNSAAGSPHSAGRRNSKASLYSRTPLSTIKE